MKLSGVAVTTIAIVVVSGVAHGEERAAIGVYGGFLATSETATDVLPGGPAGSIGFQSSLGRSLLVGAVVEIPVGSRARIHGSFGLAPNRTYRVESCGPIASVGCTFRARPEQSITVRDLAGGVLVDLLKEGTSPYVGAGLALLSYRFGDEFPYDTNHTLAPYFSAGISSRRPSGVFRFEFRNVIIRRSQLTLMRDLGAVYEVQFRFVYAFALRGGS